MKRQRVYGVTVTWHNPEKRRPPAGAGPVVLRMLMAGAQVVPSEQPLDPNKADAKAVFYVTPLAKGWMRHECLEVLIGGRKVQELPLKDKVTSQRLSWFFLILAFMVPWLIINYFLHSPWNAQPKKTRGQILAEKIADFVPNTPTFIKDTVPAIQNGLVYFRDDLISSAYDFVWDTSQNHPLHHFCAAAFLLLAVVSWFGHRDRRKRRYGKPIPLAAGRGGGPMDEDDFD
jgi:hypothetical protein